MLHEKLRCYRQAVQLAEELAIQMEDWPKGYGYLADQVKRALASCILNCSEGNARLSKLERRRFFQISRASIAEVGACIDLMRAYHLITTEQSQSWKEVCHAISKMLYALT